MPFVNSRQMLLDAQAGHYAVGAFNTDNMEIAQAIISAAEELSAPVIIMVSSSTLKYGSPELFAAMVKTLAEKAAVPVSLQLDHGVSFEETKICVDAGFSAVMIDGSKLPYEENVALSRQVADMAAAAGAYSEAEIGSVVGKAADAGFETAYTDPVQAKAFAEATGCSSLAVSIGTAHGFYKGIPVLDVERLSKIREMVEVPLVMHGASGLTDEQIKECAERGICKVNICTELRNAFSRTIAAYFEKDPGVVDPKKYGKEAREAVKALVKEKILVCGCDGKA